MTVSPRRRPRTRIVVLYALLGVGVLAHGLHAVGVFGPSTDVFFERWLYTGVMVAASAACLARAVLRRSERGAWTAIGLNLVLWSVGDALWDFWLNSLEEPPFPNVADIAYFASYAAAYVGYVLLMRARVRSWSASVWLDGLIGGLAVAALCAALVFPAVLRATEGDAMTVAVTLAYPACDLLLLCFVALACAMTGWRPGRAWWLLLAGGVIQVVTDSVYQYQESLGTYESGTLVGTGWPAAAVLTSLAAWQPLPRRRSDPKASFLPVAFGVLALGVLLYGQLAGVTRLAGLLAIAALSVGVVRAGLTLQENARMVRRSRSDADTDALSGLHNRRRLMADLRDVFVQERSCTLAFFDLDGFKQYNDAFGHGAGDALLARLGQRLRDTVHPAGTVYRLGGDEFCALLEQSGGRVQPLVADAAAALVESGEGFHIGASLGLVAIPDDAASPEQALQIADERMYAHKDRRRASGRRQARDVLMQTLREREPLLDDHHQTVAALAAGTARALGCAAEEIDEVVRAAELHDIGKIAIPDEILHKPAALTDGEWLLMRQHTIIGERILVAAPALRPVGRLVRSSHERWQGGGYPDALVGEAIPLGARIIAVCDAYDAMRADRPYAQPRSHEAALAEIRRSAGAQFDPRVVAAFLGVATPEPTARPDPVAPR